MTDTPSPFRAMHWLLPLAAAAALLTLAPIGDPDFPWHAAMGRAMVAEGRIIAEEIFSFTAPGRPFHNHEWLAQIILYGAFLAGPGGVHLLVGVLAAVAAIASAVTARLCGAGPVAASALALAATALGLPRWVPRPEAFSLTLAATVIALVHLARNQPSRAGLLWLLVPLQVLWDQIHGPVYGLLLGGGALAGDMADRRLGRRLWLPVAAQVAAAALDPAGLRQYLFFLEIARGDNGLITRLGEYMPPTTPDYWPAWLALAGLLAALALGRRRVEPAAVIMLLPLLLLACRYNRAVAFAALAAVPCLAPLLAEWRRLAPAAVAAVGLAAGVQAKGAGHLPFGTGLDADFFPVHAVSFMRQAEIQGPGYHWNGWGGLVAWNFWPERRMFSVNHHMLFPDIAETISGGRFVQRWRLDWALVGQKAELQFFPPPAWVPVYWDGTAALLVRNHPGNAAIIQRYGLRVFTPLSGEARLAALAAAEPAIVPRLVHEIRQIDAVRPSPRWRAFADRLEGATDEHR